jgi:hypothetical protein
VEVEVDDCVVKKKRKREKEGEEGNREAEIPFGPVTGKGGEACPGEGRRAGRHPHRANGSEYRMA